MKKLMIISALLLPVICFSQSIEEKNVGLVKRLIEVGYNQRNLSVVDEIADTSYVEHTNGVTSTSSDIIKQTITYLAAEVPDFKLIIDDILAQGEKVAFRWIFSGLNKKYNKQIIVHGSFFCIFKDGKMIEGWQIFDNLTRHKQLGFTLTPPALGME